MEGHPETEYYHRGCSQWGLPQEVGTGRGREATNGNGINVSGTNKCFVDAFRISFLFVLGGRGAALVLAESWDTFRIETRAPIYLFMVQKSIRKYRQTMFWFWLRSNSNAQVVEQSINTWDLLATATHNARAAKNIKWKYPWVNTL